MKRVLSALLFTVLARATMVLHIENLKQPYSIQRNVGDNQICKGNFKLETQTSGSVDIRIYSEDGLRVFNKESLRANEEVDFSFNTVEGQLYTIKIEENTPITEQPVKMQYQMHSQINTFDKGVARASVIDPALTELSRFEKLLYELSLQTAFRQKETATFSDSIGEIVITILGINFVIFLAFTGILAYQMITFKDFLKKKKLI